MNYAALHKNIISLAGLAKDESPVINAYFDLSQSKASLHKHLNSWMELSRETYTDPQIRTDLEESVQLIHGWLSDAYGRGAAVFCRMGEHPLFIAMQFEAPMETGIHVDDFPVIYPLVELKDRFNRFVVVLTTSEYARIIEMNLGAQSVKLLTERPALRERIGREWTREHYTNHRKESENRFVKEKISIIENLMSKRGHNHLILAGESRFISRMYEALPAHLKSKVIDEIKTGVNDERLGEILDQAVGSFLTHESEDAYDTVDTLMHAVRNGGLARIGVQSTRLALQHGSASKLVISNALRQKDQETLIRLASQQSIEIETVQDCELLNHNGGAGCLLRYRDDYLYRYSAAS